MLTTMILVINPHLADIPGQGEGCLCVGLKTKFNFKSNLSCCLFINFCYLLIKIHFLNLKHKGAEMFVEMFLKMSKIAFCWPVFDQFGFTLMFSIVTLDYSFKKLDILSCDIVQSRILNHKSCFWHIKKKIRML